MDIARDRRSNTVYVTGTAPKEYLNYTIEVLEDGIYTIEFRIGAATGDTEVKFYLEYDQKKTSNPRRYTVPPAAASALATVTVPDIELTKGIHTLGFYPSGNLYFDKCTFVRQPTAIREVEPAPALSSVYPNPSEGIFYVKSADNVQWISVFGTDGRKVLEKETDDPQPAIDLSEQTPGIYLLTLHTGKQTYRCKLVKQSAACR
ncbi:MAG: T9SS type A sorting domain-containing protein [Dysgonamonadaceae bacterium]|nr:T9SS type A sorting domain-containing protein [Dysgonamonadaceae bacterium]